jgi:type VI secretion system protein ImpL
MSQMMGINIPVYVLFTKSDRLPFFTDYVRNLNSEEATQVVGVTLPMVQKRSEGVYAEEEGQRLTANFEQLFRSLADARPEFLSRENDATKLPSAYEFPREFRKIRPAVVQFLVDLCRPSQLTVGPFLRGYYFTGVRPIVINEAAPVAAPVSQQAASAGATSIFAMRTPVAAAQAAPAGPVTGRKVPQWLFLTHFFNDVLMADKAAQGASGSSIKVSGTRRWLFIAAASLCFLLLVFFTISFIRNRGLENDVRAAALGIPAFESSGQDLPSLPALQKLDILRDKLQTIAKWRIDGHPITYGAFLYIGDDLYDEARKIYCDRFRQLLLRQTQGFMVSYLNSAPISNAEYGATYEALRGYLITTQHPDRSDSQLPPALMRFWTNDGTRIIDPDRKRLAQAQFDFYQQDLLIQPACAGGGDLGTIAGARAYLKKMGGARAFYQGLLAKANAKFKRLNFNAEFPGSEKAVLDPYWVKGAFTKDGWKFMTDAIANPDKAKGEVWVLGDDGTAGVDLARLALEIKPMYTADYLDVWRSYLKQATVLRCTNPPDAANKLALLSSPQSPLLELFFLASQNTDVNDPDIKKAFQPVHSVVPPSNTDRLAGPTNQSYMQSLLELQTSVDQSKDQNPLTDAAVSTIQGASGKAKSNATQLAYGFTLDPGGVDKQTSALLLAPISNTEACCRGPLPAEALNKAGAGFCGQFRPLLNKYPFNLNATQEASVDDVDRIFRKPDGALWQFYEQNLKALLPKQGNTYTPVPGKITLNPAFISYFTTSLQFGDAIYAEGQEPRFTYKLTSVPTEGLTGGTLQIDGQKLNYTPVSTQQFIWRGRTDPHGTSGTLKFGTSDFDWPPNESGLWAVFKFFNAAETWTPSATGQTLEYVLRAGKSPVTVGGKQVKIRLDLNMGPVPIFSKNFFAKMACVATVGK